MRKLALAESYKKARTAEPVKEEESGDGFVQRLLNSILTTLQVRIKGVHVRYEDPGLGTPEQRERLDSMSYCPAFCAGIVLDSLELISTDSQWQASETSTAIAEALLYKLVRLSSLSMYIDIGDHSILKACGVDDVSGSGNPDFKKFETLMADTSTKRHDSTPHHHFLEPTGGSLKITLNRKSDNFDFPKLNAILTLQRIGLLVQPTQLHAGMFSISRVEHASAALLYLKGKPKSRPSESPKEWWKYVIDSVLAPIRRQRALISPQACEKRRLQREEYVPIYEKLLTKPSSLSSAARTCLERLERELSFEEIMYFRALAEIQVKTAAAEEKQKSKESAAEPKKSGGGIGSWLGSFVWGSSSASSLPEDNSKDAQQSSSSQSTGPDSDTTGDKNDKKTSSNDLWKSIKWTDEEREAFFEVINFERPALNKNARTPPGYTEYIVSWANEAGQVTLFNMNAQPLIAFGFHKLCAGVSIQPRRTHVSLTLQSLSTMDLYSTDSLHPRLLYPQQQTNESQLLKFDLYHNSKTEKSPETTELPDFDVSLSLQKLNLVLNMQLAQVVTSSFKTQISSFLASDTPQESGFDPEKSTYWSSSSWAQSEKRNQQLLMLASMNKSVNLNIVISAPNVIIPRSCKHERSPAIVVSLGTFKLITDNSAGGSEIENTETSSSPSVVSPSTSGHISINEIASKHPIDLTGQPPIQREYYTMHKLEVSEIHAVVTSSERARTVSDLNGFAEEEQLFSPISARVSMAACKISSATLAKLRISCFATPLHIRLTSDQLQTINHIVMFVAAEASKMIPKTQEEAILIRPVISRPNDTNWAEAMTFTEQMIGASGNEAPISFGIGVSLEASSPELKLTCILSAPEPSARTQFCAELSSLGFAMESQTHSLQIKAVLGAVQLNATSPAENSEVMLLNSRLGSSIAKPTAFEDALVSISLARLKPQDPNYKFIDNECVFTFRQLSTQLHSSYIRSLMRYIRIAIATDDPELKTAEETNSGKMASPLSPTLPQAIQPLSPTISSPSNQASSHRKSDSGQPNNATMRTEFRIRFRCQTIQVALFDLDGVHLIEASLRNSEAAFSILAMSQGWFMDATIGYFVILDSSPSTSSLSTAEYRRRLLSLEKPNSVHLGLKMIPSKPKTANDFFNFDTLLVSVQMSSLRVQLNPKCLFNALLSIVDLSQSLSEISKSQKVEPIRKASKASKAGNSSLPALNSSQSSQNSSNTAANSTMILMVNVKVLDTRVFCPEDLSASRFVILDIGEVDVQSNVTPLPPKSLNAPLQLKDTMNIALTKTDLYVGLLENQVSQENSQPRHHSILADSALTITLSSVFDPNSNLPKEDNEIWIRSKSLKLVLTTEHAHILFRAAQNNVFYMPTDKELSRRLSQATLAEKIALAADPDLYEWKQIDPNARPLVMSSFNLAFDSLRLELSDSNDINSIMIQKKRLLGLELHSFECQTKMLSDDAIKVEFSAGKLSAIDLRELSTLPSIHPLHNHPEIDNEDNRMFIFPTTSSESQLSGTFSTVPSKNQMSMNLTLREFQLLPEATIVERLLKVSTPITNGLMALLAHRESIATLMMAPMQKQHFLRLKSHPETSATYVISLLRPEIVLVQRQSNFGLKFAATSPQCIEFIYSVAPTNAVTQISIADLAAAFGTTTETERRRLFELTKPLPSPSSNEGQSATSDSDLSSTTQRLLRQHNTRLYDIISPVSLEATLLLAPLEHQYAVHFINQVRICSSYSDYLEMMDLVAPFLAVNYGASSGGEDINEEDTAADAQSFSFGPVFQSSSNLPNYDPSPIRAYPSTSLNGSTPTSSSSETLLSMVGESKIGVGVASQQDGIDLKPISLEELDMEEDDLYSLIAKSANDIEEMWFKEHEANSSATVKTQQAASMQLSSPKSSHVFVSSSSESESHKAAVLANPALTNSVKARILGQPLSDRTPRGSLEISPQEPSDFENPTENTQHTAKKGETAKYIPKRLTIGSLRLELMVMDNQQSDLGLIRVKLDLVTLRLHNWDVEAFKIASESRNTSPDLNRPGNRSTQALSDTNKLPKRTAQLDAKLEADCFAPRVSAWEPLINPYRFEIVLRGRDIRMIAPSSLNLVLSENFILNYQRIISVLDADRSNANSGLKSSSLASNYAQPAASGSSDRMRNQHLYYIHNCTGQHMQYYLVEKHSGAKSVARDLTPGTEEPLTIPNEWHVNAAQHPTMPGIRGTSRLVKPKITDRAELANHRIEFTLSLRMANSTASNISVNAVGCQVFSLDNTRPFVIDVQYQQGVKVVTIKSQTTIHNNTGVPLVVGLELSTVNNDRTTQSGTSSSSRDGAKKSSSSNNPFASIFGRKPAIEAPIAPGLGASALTGTFGTGTNDGAVSTIVRDGKTTTVTQLCVVEPYGWYHIPIDIISDGILRFRPGTTGEFVSSTSSSGKSVSQGSSLQADVDYTYQWGNYRCELKGMLAHRPRYMVCLPRHASDISGVDPNSSAFSLLNPFQYSLGVCRVASKNSIISGAEEFVIHLQPPLVLENLLPSSAEYLIHELEPISRTNSSSSSSRSRSRLVDDDATPALPTVGKIQSGQRVSLHCLSTTRRIMLGLSMEGFGWSPEAIIRYPEPNGPRYFAPGEELPFNMPELSEQVELPEFTNPSSQGSKNNIPRSTIVQLENQTTELGTRLVTFYSKFWVVNKTGLPLITSADARDSTTIGAGMMSLYNSKQGQNTANKENNSSPSAKWDSILSLESLGRPAPVETRLPLTKLFDSYFSSGCIESPTSQNANLSVKNSPSLSRTSSVLSPLQSGTKSSQSIPQPHLPMIYSPGRNADNRKMCVKVEGSKWSIPLPLENVANGLSRITVKGEEVAHVDTASGIRKGLMLGGGAKLRKFFDLSLSVGPAADRFWRTTVLSFSPRYMFTNKLSVPIVFRCSNTSPSSPQNVTNSPVSQHSPSTSNTSPSSSSSSLSSSTSSSTSSSVPIVPTEGILYPGETAPWHWIGSSGGARLSNEAIEMRLDMPDCSWSGPMLLETRVMTTIAMFNPSDGSRYFVRVLPRMHATTGITTIIFKREQMETPLFKVVNRTGQAITVRQRGFSSVPSGTSKNAPSPPWAAAFDTVPPFDSRIWGWYAASTIDKGLEIAFVGGSRLPKSFSLTKVRTYPQTTAKIGHLEFEVNVTVSTDRSTRILIIEPIASWRLKATSTTSYQPFNKSSVSSPETGIQQRVGGRTPKKNNDPARPQTIVSDVSQSKLIASANAEGIAKANAVDAEERGERPKLEIPKTQASSPQRSQLESQSHSDDSTSYIDLNNLRENDANNKRDPNEYDWKIGLALQSISLSLINGVPEEVLFGVVAHIGAEVVLYPKRWTLELQVGDLHVDNQDPMTFYPVAIASAGSKPKYFLQFSLIRSMEFSDIICQPLVSLLIKETHVKVDEILILKLLNLYNAGRYSSVTNRDVSSLASSSASIGMKSSMAVPNRNRMSSTLDRSATDVQKPLLIDEDSYLNNSGIGSINSGNNSDLRLQSVGWNGGSPSTFNGTLSSAPSSQSTAIYTEQLLVSNDNVQLLDMDEDQSKMVYTEFALLNPIHILLSFQFTQRTTDDAREKALKEQAALKNSQYNPESWRGVSAPRAFPALESFLKNPLTGIFTFDRAPIFFSCLLVEHSFVSYNVLYETVVNHYSSQALKFVMAVGGSLDVAGDPVSLAYNLGSGVKDLFYEPAKGIAISPLAFGQGLGRGGAKFAKKSLYGIFNTINKGFQSLGTAAAAVSFDTDYQAKRVQRKQREQPKNVAYGVGQGAFEFGKGLFDGITGLVMQPVVGAQKEGVEGFFKGVGKGAAGLVVKPVVGAFDLVQRTAEGIKNTASDLVPTQRCRWPLYIAEDGIVRTYSRAPSLAMRILHSIKSEEFAHELFWGYFQCTFAPKSKAGSLIGTLVIASSTQIIFVATKELSPEETAASLGKNIIIPPDSTPHVEVKWQIPLGAFLGTEYKAVQYSNPASSSATASSPALNGGFILFEKQGRREKYPVFVEGDTTRAADLKQWMNVIVSRYLLLSRFYRQVEAYKDP